MEIQVTAVPEDHGRDQATKPTAAITPGRPAKHRALTPDAGKGRGWGTLIQGCVYRR
jgi:hypothetical protein